ncbi:MAG TPA: hypothetical protein VIJ38_13450 [Acidobacteriaceae bacterium]
MNDSSIARNLTFIAGASPLDIDGFSLHLVRNAECSITTCYSRDSMYAAK